MISKSVIGSVYHCITIPYKICGGGWLRRGKSIYLSMAYQRKVSSGRLVLVFHI